MDLPNEIICQFYRHLNPKDQTRFSLTNKIIRRCIPDWKSNHQKLFIHCINEINEIKYGIHEWNTQIDYISTLGHPALSSIIIMYQPMRSSWMIHKTIKHCYITENTVMRTFKTSCANTIHVLKSELNNHDPSTIVINTLNNLYPLGKYAFYTYNYVSNK